MHHDVAFAHPVTELDHLGTHPVHADAAVAVLAEDERLAILEHELMVGLDSLVADFLESVIVEDVAILKDLDKRSAAICVGALEHFAEMFLLDVDRAGDERRIRTKRDRHRIEREINRAGGVDLVTLPTSEVGEYWPLVRP